MIRLEHTILIAIPPLQGNIQGLICSLRMPLRTFRVSVPGVSNNSSVPTWNMRSNNYFEALFTFAYNNLRDDAVILIIHSIEPQVLKDLQEWAFEYGYD